MKKKSGFFAFVCVVTILFFVTPNAAFSQEKRPIAHDDYDSWKSISASAISADGNWILFIETPQKGEADLVVMNLKNGKEFRHAVGFTGEGTTSHRSSNPQFSFDSSHVVFLISPSQEEIKESKKKQDDGLDQGRGSGNDQADLKKKLGIMELANGQVTLIEMVKEFEIPEKGSGWVAYLKEAPPKDEKQEETKEKVEETAPEAKKPEQKKPEEKEEKKEEKKKDYGTQLILRSLGDGQETAFESVLSFQFTKTGTYLFYTVSSKEKPETDGFYRIGPGQSSGIALLQGIGNYKQLTLNENETRLAFVTDRDDYEADEPTFNLYGMEIGGPQAQLWVSHTSTAGFPEGMAVSDKSSPSFTDDGKIVMFGIKEIPEPKKEDAEEEEEEKPQFDLWHWNDPYPQPQQKLMAQRVRNNTWESVYHIDEKKFVKLADEELPDVSLIPSGKIAWGTSIVPYTKMVSYYGSFYDVYLVDPMTGNRTLVKKKLFGRASISPEGNFMTWFEDGDWFVYDVANKTTKNITESIDVRFDREDDDRPMPSGSYGSAGWTENDRSILLYDMYDIWEIMPDGTGARMITEGHGRKTDITFRYVRLDRE